MFRSIQCLRALAASMVVTYHIFQDFTWIGYGTEHWLAGGVDIFFVISGFVMVSSTYGRDLRPSGFLRARIVRIVPLYWIMTAAFVGLIWLGIADRPLPAPGELLKSLLFIFYWDPYQAQATPILLVGWTLNYEMYFYLLFALTIRLKPEMQLLSLAVFFAVMVVLRRYFDEQTDPMLFRLTSPLPFEFVAGMVLALINRRGLLSRLPGWLGIVAMIAGFVALANAPSMTRVIAFGVPAAVIVAGGVLAERHFGSATRPLQVLGDASYSLYLSHALVLYVLAWMGAESQPSLFMAAVLAAVCVLVALACHRFVELPCSRAAGQVLAPSWAAKGAGGR